MEKTTGNRLGDFLRAQRAQVSPQAAGLPAIGGRRVAGLRREEVAVLAGVSADYYARLEQGRERTPSAQVVDALCQALRLGPDGREHAFRLAKLSPTGPVAVDDVSPELLEMMKTFPQSAVYITNPAFRMLAANSVARGLVAPLSGRANMLSSIFLEQAARDYYVNWEEVSAAAVSALRLAAGFIPPHPEVTELVDELHRESAQFRRMWNDENVTGLAVTQKIINHPDVGVLRLSYQTFDVRSAPGQQLTVATAADAGSSSADALALLGTIDATRRSERV